VPRVAGRQRQNLRRDPAGRVDAVGDRADRHLAGVKPGPQPGEHFPADLTVQPAHPVHPLGQAHAHHGHVEHRRVPAGVGLRAQGQDPVTRQRRVRRVPAELALHQIPGEPVDPGGHRGVRGENGAGPAQPDGLLEAQPLGRVLTDPFQAEEARVPLVGVEDLGLRMAGQLAVGAHRAHAAHAQQQFLAQPVLAAAPVQPVGDLPQARIVLFHVGVEQQQRHPAHLRQPHLRRQRAALAQGERHGHRGAVAAAQQGDRQAVGVTGRVALELPPFRRQRLAEVAVPVEQPHPDQRDPQVAGGLEVVAGQDAQAAGVLRQRGRDPVLG